MYYLSLWKVSVSGKCRDKLLACWQKAEGFIPIWFKSEYKIFYSSVRKLWTQQNTHNHNTIAVIQLIKTTYRKSYRQSTHSHCMLKHMHGLKESRIFPKDMLISRWFWFNYTWFWTWKQMPQRGIPVTLHWSPAKGSMHSWHAVLCFFLSLRRHKNWHVNFCIDVHMHSLMINAHIHGSNKTPPMSSLLC